MNKIEQIIKEELKKFLLQGIIIEELEIPKLTAPPNLKSKVAVNITKPQSQTDKQARDVLDSETPQQVLGTDEDPYSALKAKFLAHVEKYADSLQGKAKTPAPKIQLAIDDFKSRLGTADTIDQIKKAEKILNSELENLETEKSFGPDV